MPNFLWSIDTKVFSTTCPPIDEYKCPIRLGLTSIRDMKRLLTRYQKLSLRNKLSTLLYPPAGDRQEEEGYGYDSSHEEMLYFATDED